MGGQHIPAPRTKQTLHLESMIETYIAGFIKARKWWFNGGRIQATPTEGCAITEQTRCEGEDPAKPACYPLRPAAFQPVVPNLLKYDDLRHNHLRN